MSELQDRIAQLKDEGLQDWEIRLFLDAEGFFHVEKGLLKFLNRMTLNQNRRTAP